MKEFFLQKKVRLEFEHKKQDLYTTFYHSQWNQDRYNWTKKVFTPMSAFFCHCKVNHKITTCEYRYKLYQVPELYNAIDSPPEKNSSLLDILPNDCIQIIFAQFASMPYVISGQFGIFSMVCKQFKTLVDSMIEKRDFWFPFLMDLDHFETPLSIHLYEKWLAPCALRIYTPNPQKLIYQLFYLGICGMGIEYQKVLYEKYLEWFNGGPRSRRELANKLIGNLIEESSTRRLEFLTWFGRIMNIPFVRESLTEFPKGGRIASCARIFNHCFAHIFISCCHFDDWGNKSKVFGDLFEVFVESTNNIKAVLAFFNADASFVREIAQSRASLVLMMGKLTKELIEAAIPFVTDTGLATFAKDSTRLNFKRFTQTKCTKHLIPKLRQFIIEVLDHNEKGNRRLQIKLKILDSLDSSTITKWITKL